MDLKSLKTVAEPPYPTTEGIERNCAYANLLLDSYGGCVSETTAILTYMYQNYVTGTYEKQVAEVLKRIAIVEMHHHEMLGETILALGGNPMIISSCHRYWDSKIINYTTSLCKMIKSDIEGEKQAIAGYEKAICMIRDKKVQDILKRIVMDEEVHLVCLHELLQYAMFYEK